MNAHLPLVSSPHSGYALVTSMLLLLVMTVLGISMYGNTQVQEQMAFNTLVKNRTFIAANSILQQYWSNEGVQLDVRNASTDSKDYAFDHLIIDASIKLEQVDSSNVVASGFTLNTNRTYTTSQWKRQVFVATATATEAKTNATTTIQQGGQKLSEIPNNKR